MNDIKVELRQVSASTSEASLRSHQLLIDRPQEKGGTDQGPMGGEFFLAAIGGCFMSNFAAIAARKADIGDAGCGSPARSPKRLPALRPSRCS